MNIFEEYINKITTLILKNQKILKLGKLNNFKGIVVESPPVEFDFDLSCNAGLVLGKINKIDPKELAKRIKDLILKDFKDFEKPSVNNNGDIIIRKKLIKRKTNDSSILTNIFKEMIKNDVKKTGFKTLFRI